MGKDKCTQTLKELSIPFDGYYQTRAHTDRPTGCIWHTNGKGYFNPTGKTAFRDQAPICHDVFLKLALNKNACPDGYGLIMEKDKCTQTLKELSIPFDGYYQTRAHTDRPTGCIWHTNRKGN